MDAEKAKKDRVMGMFRLPLEDLMSKPGKKFSNPDGFQLINPNDRQVCKDDKGRICKIYLTFQYIDEGQPIPPPPAKMTGGAGDSDVVSRALDSGPPPPTKASLFVRIIKGNDFKAMDSMPFTTHGTDAYCKLALDGEGSDKTRVIDKLLNPVWNEDFFFSPDVDSNKTLEIKVMDNDKGPRLDEEMGWVKINCADIRAAKTMSQKVFEIVDKRGPVKGKSGKIATLTLDLEWK